MTITKLFAVLIALVILFVAAEAQQASLTVPGLNDVVSVRRDSRSIPYIDAKTEADLYFAQGYVTAGDRLWQMDLLRRVARGETAEIFGRTTLEEDKRWRRFGFKAIAEQSLSHLNPRLRSALDSYAGGVNAYIATLDEKTLPVEFRILQYRPRAWTAADSVVIGKILADALSSTWRNDLLRASVASLPKEKLADLTNQMTPYDVILFGKDTGNAERGMRNGEFVSEEILAKLEVMENVRAASLSRVGLHAEELAASNNWVISGKRTADGKPLLANDPHLAPSAPGIWYLTHLATAGMRVAGVTFPGVPGVVLGHNEHIAWGATNVGPDVQDLYIETFDAEGNYKTPAGSAKPIIRREEIKVRTTPLKPDTVIEPLEVIETRNGPIILEDGGKRYALKWTARDPKNNEFESFYFLNRAKDWNGFKTALRNYGGATQNFVYADVKGNIGWYAAGRIPLRKAGDGSLPYDGSTNDGEWVGNIPFEELPNLYNPVEGFIVTANQRIVGTGYKYASLLSRDAAPPWRARRIYDLLKANSKVTMDDASAIQHDAYNIPLANMAKLIAEDRHGDIYDALRSWDGRMSPEKVAPLIANEIRNCIANRMAEDNKPAPASVIRERVVNWAVQSLSPRWLPKGFGSYDALIETCVRETPATLAGRKQSVWGDASKSRFPHPLAVAPLIGGQFATPAVGLSGSGQTPNVASAVSMRHIASPGNWDATRFVIPLGQSGNPQSPHYKDQFDMWRTGTTPAVFPFSAAAIEAGAKAVDLLRPQN